MVVGFLPVKHSSFAFNELVSLLQIENEIIFADLNISNTCFFCIGLFTGPMGHSRLTGMNSIMNEYYSLFII